MSAGVTSEIETAGSPRRVGLDQVAFFAAKLAVTAGCFWYVSRQVDFAQLASAIPQLNLRWAAFGTLMAVAEIPLLALRWRNILAALGALNRRTTYGAVTAVTAIGIFFVQVLPSVAGDGVRAWLLVRLGADWRSAVSSVVIDRGVGVLLLLAIGFIALLLPSGLIALGSYRQMVLLAYGAVLVGGGVALLLIPTIAPLLCRWRYSRWIGVLAEAVYRVLLGPRSAVILGLGIAVHALTVLIVWCVASAQGLALPLSDAAVLFAVMVGVGLVPISVGGWGLREVAVVSLLAGHGMPPEKALLFSVCFGLVLAAGSLPGVLVWLVYSVAPVRTDLAQTEAS
jgi:glycosyltransferase 2 family protein